MTIPVYIEAGSKRVFAGTLEWPGWCRSGKNEESALQSLFDYAERYRKAISSAKLGLATPTKPSEFKVAERLKGDTTTDFGAPGSIPTYDQLPVGEAELRRLQAILKACWRTLEQAAISAEGKTLRMGARGGGRSLDKVIGHVLDAQSAYVSKLGWKSAAKGAGVQERGKIALEALTAAAHGELPLQGPRGGLHWPARYFVRRAAWHVLDHAWEIEDRAG